MMQFPLPSPTRTIPPAPFLAQLAGLTPTADGIIIGSDASPSAWVVESGATARASLGLAIGTNVQAYDAGLDQIAALVPTVGQTIVADASGNWTVGTSAPSGPAGGDLGGTYPNPSVDRVAGVTPGAGGLAVLDDASVAAVRTTLGAQVTVVTATVETAVSLPACSFVMIQAVGGGGGGGGGFSAASGNARGGGGGGGSGASVRGVFSRSTLPATLFVTAGTGGTGGAAGAAGGVATRCRVDVVTGGATVSAILLASETSAATGGGAGTGVGVGSGGNGGTVPGGATHAFFPLGATQTTAGAAGVAGGSQNGAVGVSTTFGQAAVATYLTGGAGGAGVGAADTGFAGGAITGAGPVSTVAGGLANGGAGNAGGQNQAIASFATTQALLYFTGGSGGGSFGTGVGGRGGDGAPGCGGGGGGGGTTGGAGGNGGNGFVIITCW